MDFNEALPTRGQVSRAGRLLLSDDTLRVRVSPPQKARGQVVTVNQNQVDGLLGQARLIGFARQFRPVGNMGRAAART